jgi:hypothetical protein
MVLLLHARIHLFYGGNFCPHRSDTYREIAPTLLKEGRHAGWYALLFGVIVDGGIDLVMDCLSYQ